MTDGSILVMGGDRGSNGVEEPCLEGLIPPTGVTQSCDYLGRTRSWNVHPFLVSCRLAAYSSLITAVLPAICRSMPTALFCGQTAR